MKGNTKMKSIETKFTHEAQKSETEQVTRSSEYEMLANERDVLTVKDVQRILSVGKTSAYGLIDTGRIPSIKIGTRRIIPKIYLLAFLKTAS